jgi:hypothetical protein
MKYREKNQEKSNYSLQNIMQLIYIYIYIYIYNQSLLKKNLTQ